MECKPIIKCPGGKRKLTSLLYSYFPEDFEKKPYVYVEPFLGGASVFLYLCNNKKINPELAILNDYNRDLYNLYTCIQNEPDTLVKFCSEYSKNVSKEEFIHIKSIFNNYSFEDLQTKGDKLLFINKAAMFLYLNKTCFNGLIRYNKSNLFNSPYGKYKNPSIYNIDNISLFFKHICKTTILNLDFEVLIKALISCISHDNVFIYLDPPYLPSSDTAYFTEYTAEGFSLTDHERILACLDLLPKSWKFLLSNSNTEATKRVFSKYDINELSANRSISAKNKGRGLVKELLIKNY